MKGHWEDGGKAWVEDLEPASIERHLVKALRDLGYAVVPKEPTEKMIIAGLAVTAAWHDLPGSGLTVSREKMRRRYVAMVEAAANDGVTLTTG